ncbi:hypothetical protein RYX36_028305 [Vicia faba]
MSLTKERETDEIERLGRVMNDVAMVADRIKFKVRRLRNCERRREFGESEMAGGGAMEMRNNIAESKELKKTVEEGDVERRCVRE